MKYFIYVVILLGIVCGVMFPGLGAYRRAVPYLIGFLLFMNFFEIQVLWQRLFRVELLVTVALSIGIMPVLAYYVLSWGLPEEYRIGVLLTAIAPTGIMTLVLCRFIPEKDYNLLLSNFLLSQFGCILYIPFLLRMFVGSMVELNTVHLFLQVCALVLIPYGVSRLLKSLVSLTVAEQIKRSGRVVVPFVIFFIIFLSLSGVTEQIRWEFSLLRLAIVVFGVFLVQGGLAYLAGMLFRDRGVQNSLALTASSRNTTLMVGIGVLHFTPVVIVPCVLGIIFHHLTNAGWLWLFRK
jgi:predicted Na+-dependent transporter